MPDASQMIIPFARRATRQKAAAVSSGSPEDVRRTQNDAWDGDQKLIALGIVAGTRVASVLVSEIASAIKSKNHSDGGYSDSDTKSK